MVNTHTPADASRLTSLQAHILEEETRYPGSTGDFTWILSALSLAAKIISAKIRRARLDDVLGEAGGANVHGETQQKLDVIANDTLMTCLGSRPSMAIVASEENDEPTILRRGIEGGKYCVVFDPLDGSSNLDTGVSVGTIFSILRNDPAISGAVKTLCQPGACQVAAGYVLYGSSTVLVLTTGRGVDLFVLDAMIGSFVLVQRGLKIPVSGRTYSINEAYRARFSPGIGRYLDWAHEQGYSSRYVGSMVADVHRTLLKGGVFLYPPTTDRPDGKLRLLYEANPMAMIVEQAGGRALALPSTGIVRVMDVEPTSIHQRTSLVLGSVEEVEAVVRHLS